MNTRTPNKHLPSKFRYIFVKEKVVMGSITRALDPQSTEFARWLITQIPDEGTLAELLVAYALDEWLDRKE